jgi:GNAT superfamily N-acetyltransferase
MSKSSPIPLTPVLIGLDSSEFEAISGWPFVDPFVARLLRNDIPQRVQFGNCQIWIYRDPQERLVGFGTLDVCGECREYTGNRDHPYIPLLAVNPTIKSQGYGTSIVRHLIEEAALLAFQGLCHDVLFLDVYTSSVKAISVYTACGFADITTEPILDTQEGEKTYIVMAKRVAIVR